MSKIINAKVTFHKSPIHILERFTFRDPEAALREFKAHSNLDECVVLQTCNRVELFAAASGYNQERIRKTWASLAGLDEGAFHANFELSEGEQVYSHLLRLASGLDSMVVGEEQILGQIKGAIARSKNLRMSGQRLNTLFDKAVRAGTRIRNDTGIGRGGISVGSMAVKLVEENIDDLKSKSILIIGTGEVSTLVAKSLARRGYSFSVASRTLSRSSAFCESMGGSPVRFQDVLGSFAEYDAVFVATTAPYFLVSFDRITEAVGSRPHGMMILDLSNPTTVDQRVATLSGVKLMNLDQIAEMVDKNMRNRLSKVGLAEDIIREEAEMIGASMRRLDAEPIVKSVFGSAEASRKRELEKALRMLGETDSAKIKIIEDLTKAIAEGAVSEFMNNLRKASEEGDDTVLDAARRIFGCGDSKL